MQPRLTALGATLLGLGMFAYALPIARFDPGLGLGSTLFAGAALLVAAAGFARGPGGEGLVALGLAAACAEALLSLRNLSGDLTVLMSLVWAGGLVQAAWFAAQWAAKPEEARRWAAGVRLGLAFAALSPLGWLLNDLALADLLWWPGNLLTLAGAVLAAQGLAPPVPPAPRPPEEPEPADAHAAAP